MKNEMKIQNTFNLICGQTPILPIIINGFHSPRGWQERAFKDLGEERLMILNAPMGSGKSWLMCLLSAYKMETNRNLRSIIAVPQTIIAPGFANAKLRMPTGECLDWRVNHNLCRKEASKGTVKYVIDWLSQQYSSLDDRVLLCTHATLVQAYKKLKAQNSLHLLTDLLLWVDEAHHVKNISMEDIEGETISNGIGELVQHLLTFSGDSVQLGLTTASFFRGDRCSLLTPSMECQFKRFNLPYDEYLQSMEHLKSFSFDFLLCGHEYTNAIGTLIKSRKGKDIIYIPHPRSRHSTGKKLDEVQSIFSEYQKIFGGELIETSQGLTILHNPISPLKVLDLVDEDRRAQKKEFLNSEKLKKEREALDSIIALGMFKEGANWIWADRSIIVGARASLVDVVQMMGRLFRDATGKEHVEIIQLLPFSLDQQSDSFRDNLNNYLKAVYASLILEDILNPVKISVPISKTENDIKEAMPIKKDGVSMSDLIPDESTRLSVLEDVVNRLASISESNKVEGEKKISNLYETYQNELPEILQEYGITERTTEIGEKLWSMLLRRSAPSLEGINVEEIEFEIVQRTHPLEGIIRYTSSACGIDTLAQLRQAIQSWAEEKEARWEFYFQLLEKYTEEHGSCRIHKNYEVVVNEKIVKLGSWFNDQKKNFNILPLRKQTRLQALPGFIAKKWKRNKSLSVDAWIDMFISVSTRLETPIIPNRHVEDGYNLHAWTQYIRKEKEWQKLTPEQQQRLLDNNFKLSLNEEWSEAAVLAMKQFEMREGHSVPKTEHKEVIVHKGVKYSIRLDNLRNKIKKSPREVDDIILQGVKDIPNFFESLQTDEEDDETYLARGLEYYRKFKQRTHCTIIPKGHMEGDFDLSGWGKSVSNRKQVTSAFKDTLLQIDPYFFAAYPVKLFMQNLYPRIEAYIQEHGHALIPQEYVCSDGDRLGERISDLRSKKGKLPKEIEDYLLSLGDKWAWNSFEYSHIQNAKTLIEYFEKNGYASNALPKKIRELKPKVKSGFEKYPTTQYLKQRIEELAPNIFAEPKDESYLALLSFVEREGHARPKIKDIENGIKIGYYVSNIRSKYKNGSISEEDRIKFESLPGWVWSAYNKEPALQIR